MDRLPGFRDFYPEPVPHPDLWSADLRNYLFEKWRATARSYGFREYDGPPLESLELITTKSGEEIVGQLYNFTDKGDRPVALRPEMTPTLARMVAAHERNYRKPIKWFAIPQLFRYERQQRGRLREHYQLNADLFGETDPAADAELIALLIDVLRALNLTSNDFHIRLSSRQAWQQFYDRKCAGQDKAYEFFQVVDKLEREDPAQSDAQLQRLGFTLTEVRDFIQKAQPTAELSAILANLSARGLADFVTIDYNVIRGLAYYTGVVFEAFDRQSRFRAIAGGGRYDNLVKLISGGKVDLPALGFGLGDVVLTELLKDRKLLPTCNPGVDVFCLIEEESRRPDTLRLIQELRQAGASVEYSLTPARSEKQFKRALECKARFTARLTAAPDGSQWIQAKNLSSREERSLDLPGFIAWLG
ncbi:MAG TPA: histidine--tRNA ligase [Candidatus Paceibacterota bacterium]|nr:histidine--tRNA ligase [Verrucomicrobiota bacterium]HRY46627.1 histidine--tRNA ligase [Candidatus Paceibacterota bacterium]HSA03000.1 histidine--tRNA ligase [Candidatus Paceibacterota bacterium]